MTNAALSFPEACAGFVQRRPDAGAADRLEPLVRTIGFDIGSLPHYNADLTDDPRVAALQTGDCPRPTASSIVTPGIQLSRSPAC